MIADVNKMALLGREPAERASGVDEDDETERDGQSRLQQPIFYCKESRQRNENANTDVPSAHELLLKGEWLVCASGEASDWNGDANTSNAAVERVDSPSESRVTEDTPEVESEGCERGTSEGACVDEEDGDPGCRIEPPGVPNESDMLVTVLIESESPNGGEIPRVHLGGTRLRAGDANGHGRGTDVSRGLTDASNASNKAEMDGMSNSEGAGTYLGAGGANRVVNATDGFGSQTDALTGPMDVPSVEADALTTANAPGIVSTPRKRQKPPNSPVETAKRHPDKPNGCGSRAYWSSVRTDAHCGGNETETAANATQRVRTRQIGSKTQDSPYTTEVATPKPTSRWKQVSAGDSDVYVPWNVPVEALGTASRRITFGQAESGDEAIAPSVESERAGEWNGGDGRRNGDVGDVDGTTSGGDIDSKRVEAALLAVGSQHTRQSRRTRNNDLPMSSWAPIQHANHPYGLVRRRRRRGRLKIERIKVSKAQQDETAYLGRAHATQPPGNYPNQAYRVIGLGRRRGRIKIAPTNVSRTRNGGNTYLRRVIAMRSNWKPKKDARRLDELTFDCRMQGERRRGDGDYG